MPKGSPSRRARLLGGIALVAVALGSTPGVAATPGLPRGAEQALDALRKADDLGAYAALRRVWQRWDQVDPTLLEDAFSAVAADTKRSAPVRAYAGMLQAYSRRRRGDLDGARRKIRELGFVDRFLVVGPFDNEGKAGSAADLGPELDLAEPLSTARAYDGKERTVRWRVAPNVYPYGWLDFGDLVRPQEKVCAFATTFVRAKSGKAERASLWIGATGAFKAYLNGAPVLADASYRQLDADRLAAPLALAAGWNRLTIKACGDDDAPMVAVRLADPAGAPTSALEISVDSDDFAEAAASSKKTSPKARVPAAFGPLARFEKATAGTSGSPEQLEAFARYLVSTGGDDPAEHRARALSRRAAERAPTVARALLAGDLAEDRNQRRDWIGRAERLAKTREERIDVLLAKASLARTGPSWREAVPFYEEVLALDPDDLVALLGRVELYDDAGLKRSALAAIEAAVERNPRSIGLLRVLAAHLREVGRETEAAEAEDRYAAMRFDDTAWLSQNVDLAVARRDDASARRWISRLLAADPDSSWAIAAAARAYRALGDDGSALVAWQSALELSPDDVDVLRAIADLHGERGQSTEELGMLRRILAVRPQEKDVREHVEHLEPPKARADEAYAWSPEVFLAKRGAPAANANRRTIRNLQVSTVFPNGLGSRFYQIVFQPLTDEEAAQAREYAFSFQADAQVVQLRAAKVYRPSGRVDEAVESGEGPADNPAIATYTSARTYWVHFPRLDAGDVVELRYRVDDVTPRNELADSFGEVVYLQSVEPVASAQYVVRVPKARKLNVLASRLPGLRVAESEDEALHTFDFSIDDVAPIVREPAMPPLAEALGHVHVSTWERWDDVAKFYFGLSHDQFVADDEVRALVRKLTKDKTEPVDKVRAVYDWVVQRTRYVALEFGIYGYKPRRAAQTYARGWGDCKDKATLIVTMLREAGIPASIVLVRTGHRGEFETAPASLAPFDHAIAYVPSLDLYLDGTAEWTGSNELPSMDRGALALVVDDQGAGNLVHLPSAPPDATVRKRRVEATISADGAAQIDARYEVSGAYASEWRQRYHTQGAPRRERIGRDLAAELPGFELAPGAAAVETNDLEDVEAPVSMRVRGKAASFARREGRELSVATGITQRLQPLYASLATRTTELRVSFRSRIEDELVLHVPAGMRAVSTPEPTKIETPFGSATLEVDAAPGKITLRGSLTIDRTRVPPAEYPAWRSFCEAVDRAFAQRVVLAAGGSK